MDASRRVLPPAPWAVDVGLGPALGAADTIRILLAREPQARPDPFAYLLALGTAGLALFRRRSA
jgi:hypothetical protein